MTGVGLQIPKFTFPGVRPDGLFDRVTAVARSAEEAGFESVWVADHFFQVPEMGGSRMPMLEAYTLLGALAAVTSTVRLGTLVSGVTNRPPGALAKQVTTLDVLSRGRAVLGIGAGWYQGEHAALDIPLPPLAERLERLDEAVQVCRLLFQATGPVSFDGRYYRLAEAMNMPRPVQAGGPRIVVGGGHNDGVFGVAVRHADACNLLGTFEAVRDKLALLDRLCEDAGRDPASLGRWLLSTVIVTDTADEADQLRKAFGEAPVVVGTEDDVVEAVQARAALGLDMLIVNLPAATDPADVAHMGALLRKALS